MADRSPLPAPPTPGEVLLTGWHRPHRPRGARTWQVLGAVALVVGMALLAVVVLALVAGDTGVTGFAVGVLLATLPAVAVVAAYLWVDRYEPEPRGQLAFLVAWGAVVAALVSALANSAGAALLIAVQGQPDAMAATAVLVAPPVEEVTKGLGILAVLLVRRHEFDGLVDGVVAAGMVGVGFAFTENVLYFGRAFLMGAEAGAQAGTGAGGGLFAAGAVFVLRGVLSPFAHPLFTTATGLGLGVAAVTARPVLRVVAPLVGLAVAIALHALWNLASVAGAQGFFATYVVVVLPLFGLAVAAVVWLRRREGRVIERELPAYVRAGWVPPYDVGMVAALPARTQAREWARAWGGEEAERAMRDYQVVATELAFLRDRLARGVEVPDARAHEHALLAELVEHRTGFARHLPRAG